MTADIELKPAQVEPTGWLITTPSGSHSWFTKGKSEVEHFQLPGQGHKVEALYKIPCSHGCKLSLNGSGVAPVQCAGKCVRWKP